MSDFFLPVFYSVVQLLIIMLVGFLVRKSGNWADSFFTGLSRLVVRVALPLYFVVRVSRTDLSQLRTMLILPVSAIVVVGAGLLISVILFTVLPFSGSDRRAGIAMASFGNSGYMPLALAEIVPATVPILAESVGVEFPPVLIAAYLFLQSPILWSLGRTIITRSDEESGRIRLRQLISPPLIGIVIGLLLAVLNFGRLLENPALPVGAVFAAMERISAITLPLALLNLGGIIGGLTVSRSDWRLLIGVSGVVALVRLVLIPALFYGAFFLFLKGWQVAPAVIFVLFLETHTPPATNLSLMAGEAGINEHHTAVSLLSSYVLYVLLMPVYLAIFLSVST